MQRPGATKTDQCKIARIEALLDRDQPECAEHVLVDDIDDALGRRLDGQSHGIGNAADRALGSLAVEQHVAAQLGPGGQVAEHDVGVGHRGLLAALAVGGGARLGARALRANAQGFGQFGDVGD